MPPRRNKSKGNRKNPARRRRLARKGTLSRALSRSASKTTPSRTSNRAVDDPNLLLQVIEECREMQGGYAVQMVRRELENVDVIWRRFLRIREALLTVTARMDYLSDLGFLNTPQQKRLDIQYDELVA